MPSAGSADHRPVRFWIDQLGHEFNSYFVFGFVRNPWDRIVSIYHGRQQRLHDRLPPFDVFVRKINAAPQAYWFKHNGKIRAHFIGRFEHLERDFNQVCRATGIGEVPLPHMNKSIHRHYKDYYTPELQSIVSQKYHEDIETFGYTF